MRRRSWVGGAFLLLVAVGACNDGTNNPPSFPATTAAAPSPTAAAAPTTTAAPAPASAPAPAAPVGETITVARVIDGDTFELADGRRIRVLGIDSCEMSTYGGKEAKAAAEGQLQNSYNEPITMTAQPGVDVDRYGRLLRYVGLDGGYDFGETMVKYDHTGVYQGKPNDASKEYLQKLYAADLEYALNPPSGRNCDNPYPPATSSSGSSNSDSGGSSNGRDGSSTGGYCARKWWC